MPYLARLSPAPISEQTFFLFLRLVTVASAGNTTGGGWQPGQNPGRKRCAVIFPGTALPFNS